MGAYVPGAGAQLIIRFCVDHQHRLGSMVQREPFPERSTMDKDRIKGAAKQAKGSIKEAVGRVTGDTKTQAEGAAEKVSGKTRSTVGGMKDRMRDEEE
jgi:uncharacterized protein YjbJ (UPF0337 family)